MVAKLWDNFILKQAKKIQKAKTPLSARERAILVFEKGVDKPSLLSVIKAILNTEIHHHVCTEGLIEKHSLFLRGPFKNRCIHKWSRLSVKGAASYRYHASEYYAYDCKEYRLFGWFRKNN